MKTYKYKPELRWFGYAAIIIAVTQPFFKSDHWASHPTVAVVMFVGGVFLTWVFSCAKFMIDNKGLKVSTRNEEKFDSLSYKCKFSDILKISYHSKLYFLYLKPLLNGKKRKPVLLSSALNGGSELMTEIIARCSVGLEVDEFAEAALKKELQ